MALFADQLNWQLATTSRLGQNVITKALEECPLKVCQQIKFQFIDVRRGVGTLVVSGQRGITILRHPRGSGPSEAISLALIAGKRWCLLFTQ